MAFRSSDTRGNAAIPANTALLGYRLVPDMPVAEAIEVYDTAININEWAASVRRHPSWNPALEDDLRYQPEEWPTEDLRFAREVLVRTLRAFGTLQRPGATRFRDDGREEVADHSDAADILCPLDDWCILTSGHAGDCSDDREVWLGPDVLYSTAQPVNA